MAGTHQFTSSNWIQSGSEATFLSGMIVSKSADESIAISVDGNIVATTFIGDGSGLTGIATLPFFAGSGSGISRSADLGGPISLDHYIALGSGETRAAENEVSIETTHSAAFDPNYYSFNKLTDSGFLTLQSGSLSFYTGSDRTPGGDQDDVLPDSNDLASGVHRYLVYVADTGSGGDTFTIYTTVYIQGFVNVPPIIELDSPVTVSMAHDTNEINFFAHFTESQDVNENDFIRVFSASRFTIDNTTANINAASYELAMSHHQTDILEQTFDSSVLIATGTIDTIVNHPTGYGKDAPPLPSEALVFTASIANYMITNSAGTIFSNTKPTEERFEIRMLDSNATKNESVAGLSMSIVPPPTSSISNLRVELESGSFTSVGTGSYETTILYDDTSTRTDVSDLHKRYTSSIVRLSVKSDIEPPTSVTHTGTHFTTARLRRGDTENIDNTTTTFKFFRFSGSQNTASAYHASQMEHNVSYSDTTASNGFSPFSFTAGTVYFGFASNRTDNISDIRHGTHNHYSASITAPAQLIVNPVPNVIVSHATVEVESGSFATNIGYSERTASILYGFTSSLSGSETGSLEGQDKSLEYISQSIVRLRLTATVTEPFGPAHKPVNGLLFSNDAGQTHAKSFEFSSASYDTASSDFSYDDEGRYVGKYTSSWHAFNIEPGELTFQSSYTTEATTGITTETTTNAQVSMSNVPPVVINNIIYETETFGHSGIASTETERTVLFGDARVTNATSESKGWESHTHANAYASHSVTQFRVKARITEPFGPYHASASVQKFFTPKTPVSFVPVYTDAVGGSNSTLITADNNNFYAYAYYSTNVPANANQAGLSWRMRWGNSNNVYNASTDTYSAATVGGSTSGQGDNTTTYIAYKFDTPTPVNKIFLDWYNGSNYRNQDVQIKVSNVDNALTSDSNFTLLLDAGDASGGTRIITFANNTPYLWYKIEFPAFTWNYYGDDGNDIVGLDSIQFYLPEVIANVYDGADDIISTIALHTGSADVASKVIEFNTQNDRVIHYTSSFIGQELKILQSGSTVVYDYTSGSIDMNTRYNQLFVTASGQSASIIVNDTPSTLIENYAIEIETSGESNEGIQNTGTTNLPSRTLLYGETVTRDTGSLLQGFPGEYSASAVTRFRILTDITEPRGPLHHSASIRYLKYNFGQSAGDGYGHEVQFHSGSSFTASSTVEYDSQTRLVGKYTSSWITESLSHSNPKDIGSSQEYWRFRIDGDNTSYIEYTPPGENLHSAAANSDLFFTVSASKELKVENLIVEVEQDPYSSSIAGTARTASVLYGFTSSLSSSVADLIGDPWSGSAAIRLRVRGKVIEPLGLGHFKTEAFITSSNNTQKHSHVFEFSTASLNTASRSDRELNSDNLFVTHYTSSWYGGFEIEPDLTNYGFEAYVQTGSNTTGTYINDSGDISVRGISSSIENSVTSSVRINFPETTKITNLKIEAETFSGSAIGSNATRETTILHGKTITETNHSTNASYPNIESRKQMVSVRILADIEEPYGPHHTASKFTISGYDSSHIVELFTGSADISGSDNQLYDTNTSQSVSYTSSFVPIAMTNAGNSNVNVTATISNVEVMSAFGTKTLSVINTSQAITVKPAPSASSVIVSPAVSGNETDWSSSADITTYVTYLQDSNITADIVSGISASAPELTSVSPIIFPNHLSILYSENDSALSFNPVTGDSAGEDTASLTIANASMRDFTKVTQFTVNVSASNILPGNGSSSNESFAFSVVPATPREMEFWNNAGTDSHLIGSGQPYIVLPPFHGHNILYKASLPSGLEYYAPGDSAGSDVANVVMAKNSKTGPLNYSMSFSTTNALQGNYQTVNRALNFGDTGSLIVNINGDVVVNASLQQNFFTSSKSGSQELDRYDVGGFSNGTASFGSPYADKGRLILTNVGVFNNVSQSIFSGHTFFPNGYQGWAARIELDDKLRDGYNYLEFSHSINATVTQSISKFDWYYDDGLNEPTISFAGEPTLSFATTFNTEPTFSLSGVSFFQEKAPFLINLQNSVVGLAHSTYRQTTSDSIPVFQTTHAEGGFLVVTTGSSKTPLDHSLHSETGRLGLIHDNESYSLLPPSASTTASIQNLLVSASYFSNDNKLKGNIFEVQFAPYERNIAGAFNNTWLVGNHTSVPIGRFLNTSSISSKTDSTNQIEHFYDEKFRWGSASLAGPDAELNIVEVNRPDYSFFVTPANTDYDSLKDIQTSHDLQVQYFGQLQYPTASYISYPNVDLNVVNPNAVNYIQATGSGDRYYYRGFFIGTTDQTNNLLVQVETKAAAADIFASAEDGEAFDSKDIRIDVRLPGPVNAGTAGNSSGQPGTKWGVITGGTGLGNFSKVEGWNALSSFEDKDAAGSSHPLEHRFVVNLRGSNVANSDGIVLMRVRFKAAATGSEHVITRLQVDPSAG